MNEFISHIFYYTFKLYMRRITSRDWGSYIEKSGQLLQVEREQGKRSNSSFRNKGGRTRRGRTHILLFPPGTVVTLTKLITKNVSESYMHSIDW